MAPEPNNIHTKNIDDEVGSSVVIINEDDLQDVSSGDDNADENGGTEYDGYKLLQQDDTHNGITGNNNIIIFDQSESSDEEGDEVIIKPYEMHEIVNLDVDIDYQVFYFILTLFVYKLQKKLLLQNYFLLININNLIN